jgi:aquaporin related protein
MARSYTTMDLGRQRTIKMLIKVSYPHFVLQRAAVTRFDDTDTYTAQSTDGTDETDFATRLQTAKRNPANIARPVTSLQSNTTSSDTSLRDKVPQPFPAFVHGSDGHRSDNSDSALDHPNDRPRAQHSRSSRRSSQSHYEMTPDDGYRNGPRAESGRSSS